MSTVKPEETFTAYLKLADQWGDAEEADTMTIVRDIKAGISGPYGGDLVADSTDAADTALFAAGYVRCGEWEETGAYRIAPLSKMS